MTIFAVYSGDPGFTAIQQNAAAHRFAVGQWLVDATTEPTLEEVVAFNTPPPSTLSLVQIACVRLEIADFDVTGLERSVGLSVAFMIDVDVAWIFFDAPQPDTEYIVIPPDGVTKYTDYMEVTKPGMSAISLIVQRVQ